MKRTLLISTLALCMILAVGCSPKEVQTPVPAEPALDNSSQSPIAGSDLSIEVEKREGKGVSYEILTQAYLEEDLLTALGYIQEHRGFGIIKEESDSYIVYGGMGEKPTAGYAVEIEDVIKETDQIRVVVKEIEPKKGDMVAEVITYPTKVLRIKDKTLKIVVENTSGEVFEDINAENEEQANKK